MVTSSAVVGSSASSSRWPRRERDGDHGALAHAAGEFVRIRIEPTCGIGDADKVQQLDRARPRGPAVQPAMHGEALGDLQPDRQHRVERGHRLLEHDGDVLAAHRRVQRRLGQRQEIGPAPHDASAGRRMAREQTQDGAQDQAFARTGFADQADHFTGGDGDLDAVDRAHRAERDGELLERKQLRDRIGCALRRVRHCAAAAARPAHRRPG